MTEQDTVMHRKCAGAWGWRVVFRGGGVDGVTGGARVSECGCEWAGKYGQGDMRVCAGALGHVRPGDGVGGGGSESFGGDWGLGEQAIVSQKTFKHGVYPCDGELGWHGGGVG
jgi:hypothetical protein